ncbi:hypothetical protein VPH35_016258 [Triticum aestivum]|uniref:Reverse transcriptase zinc-binding domain-containing protein n=1 Tax=Aegilops tauschii subsp. strangulata TaxID=200361 RepID=A0A452ZJB2_AEGTS
MELLLAEIPSLHHDEDARVLRDCVDKKALTSSIYKLLTFAGTRCPVQAQFWSAKAPHKVRLFGWLVAKDRVHSKANLLKKHMRSEDVCELCHKESETTNHLLFDCCRVAALWPALGVSQPLCCRSIWDAKPASPTADGCWSTVLLLLLWRIWNHRH